MPAGTTQLEDQLLVPHLLVVESAVDNASGIVNGLINVYLPTVQLCYRANRTTRFFSGGGSNAKNFLPLLL